MIGVIIILGFAVAVLSAAFTSMFSGRKKVK